MRVTRTQRAVGQGAFHSAQLSWADECLTWVYDCGTVTKNGLDKALSTYLGELHDGPARGRIDFLFISHLHADHVSGLPRLLAPGLAVGTVVLPYLTPEERLYALSSFAAAEQELGNVEDVAQLISDPRGFFDARGVEAVIEVRGDDDKDDERRPFDPDDPPRQAQAEADEPSGPDVLGQRAMNDLRVIWDRSLAPSPPTGVASTDTVVSHKRSVEVVSSTGWHLWRFAFHTQQIETGKLLSFIEKLQIGIGAIPEKLEERTKYFVDLLLNHESVLRDAYKTLTSNLNRTTLSVYAGTPNGSGCWHHELTWGPWFWSRSHFDHGEAGAVGWLGTGDAHLRGPNGTDLLAHLSMKGVRDLVGTLALPHHGSSHDNDLDFLRGLMPKVCVSTAHQGHNKNWHHPGKGTVDRLAQLGIPLVRVGRDTQSELLEQISIHRC